ncbi:2-oxoglutarate dehydrogenase E1 component [Halosquirtibacter laminarini]|uniref:2-oxoglutarate dehydrogenase E1 component n=1 Tax=Halosquirtibacter laminarini TaxID=3374600 RepID=A0AC61NJL9_9BACT|nr:2-oxoglutarate dehydrogenase E1 component [Prolixibacteraceae bacterium]
MDKFSNIGNQELGSIENLYQSFLEDPDSIEPSWRHFFEGFDFAQTHFPQKPGEELISEPIQKEFRVINLIHGYRQRGHLFTRTNPVRTRRQYTPTLALENFGLSEKDLDTPFHAAQQIGMPTSPLKEIIAHLEKTYCASVGVEYLYMRKPEIVKWLQERMEVSQNRETLTNDRKRHFFHHLSHAVGFENFIHRRFVGQKRFSIEGAETLIPALDSVIEWGAELGIQEFIIGMAHRGRLNVLSNVMQKPSQEIFNEFMGTEYEDGISLGDVKYHLGYENNITTDRGKEVALKLLPNPSHLEAVGPLTMGMARGYIDHKYQKNMDRVAPIVIHGDAAIAAQGVVYESVQMEQLDGYRCGGTVHLVINNQVGFTTNYLDARSSTYCTDVAKVIRSPVFHVNGDDVEAVIYTVKLAMEFRQRFHSDVFVDILSYRKYGHNEGDEPRFTQPKLYGLIAKHPNPRDIYAKKLIESGILLESNVASKIAEVEKILDQNLEACKELGCIKIKKFLLEEQHRFRLPLAQDSMDYVSTSLPSEKITILGEEITKVSEEGGFFKKILKLNNDRKKMMAQGVIDWAIAEQLAYASLLDEGYSVRISGQDSERGTFSHRHAAWVRENSHNKYFPLKQIGGKKVPFYIYNSHLSEYGVLGFEYGYALAKPDGLSIWEAQFGDFANVAQVMFDQYISSAGEKWGLKNGITLFLPHGYEGQGPEHSSARIERLLSLCASNNMRVLNLTSSANLFHALRNQVISDIRVPMIIYTPKSLLRDPLVYDPISLLSEGTFRKVIEEPVEDSEKIKRVVFCTGKIYTDLISKIKKEKYEQIALVRVEQLYPFPTLEIQTIKEKYPNAKTHLWVQDEPHNMGTWPSIALNHMDLMLQPVTRKESGSPATGLPKQHNMRLERIVNEVFKDIK